MSVADELRAIWHRHGGLTPGLVLDEARDPEHPLHHRFDWADAVAGEKWRLQQAAALIRSVKVRTRELAPLELRAFLHVPKTADDDGEGSVSSYVPADVVQADPVLTALVLSQMEREWRLLKRRFDAHRDEFLRIVRDDLKGEAQAS